MQRYNAAVLSPPIKTANMKKITLIVLAIACMSTTVSAQKTTVTKKVDASNTQTLKTTPENTLIKKLPDLRVSALSFSHVSTAMVNGAATHTFQINYTVVNDGNLAVAANTVVLQGFIHRTNLPTTGGCGSVVSTQSTEMINPGASRSGFFRCTAPFDKNNPPLYRLWIDSDNILKESNKENNMAQMTIIF
jgi:hypothetical protein